MRISKNQIFLVAVILFWFAQYVYVPHQVNYLEELRVDKSMIGFIIACYGLTSVILRLPAGFIADRYNLKRPLINQRGLCLIRG